MLELVEDGKHVIRNDGDGGCGEVFFDEEVSGETSDSDTYDDDFHDVG